MAVMDENSALLAIFFVIKERNQEVQPSLIVLDVVLSLLERQQGMVIWNMANVKVDVQVGSGFWDVVIRLTAEFLRVQTEGSVM